MVRNAVAEAENKIRTINATVQPSGCRRRPRKFMGTLGGNISIQMSGVGSIFQYEENNSMVAESR